MADDWELDGEDALPPPPSSTRTAMASPVSPFTTIGGYEIGRELGRGGMGVVYSATHLKLGRKAALKLILTGVFAHRTERERFVAEARTTAALEHPNIIRIHDVGEFGSTPYMALEFVEGGTLADLIARQPLPGRRAAEIVERLARAVAFAHSKSVVHRDIKPANVFLSLDGPKLGDFGVAKIHESAVGASGTMTGTPSYMAPEQAAGKPTTPLIDVYSLGAVLYECVTGRPPFKAATIAETLHQVLESTPVEPRKLQPNLSKDLDTICMKCLEKEPSRRYASAHDLAEDLTRFLEGRPITARPISRPERMARWIKAHPRDSFWIGAVIVAFLGGTLGIYLQYRQTAFHFSRAESNFTNAEQRRREAETAQQTAETRQKDLERAVDNMAYLVGVIDLDQLFHFRMLHVDRELLTPALAANLKFLEEHQGDAEREPEIVASMYRVALLTRMIGDKPKALRLGLESLERQERFVAANPEVAQYKRDLAASYHNVGFLTHGSGKFDDEDKALLYLGRARRIREEFVESQPENLDYRSELAGCLNDIGLAWVAKNDLKPDAASIASAEQALSAARDHQRTVVQRAGHVPRYRLLLGNHLFNLGRLYAKSGRDKEAIAAADELQQTLQYENDAKVRASRIYCLAASLGGDAARDYENRAIELLLEGLASATSEEGMALVHSDFQPITKRVEYRRLYNEFVANR